jgi:hypothetical protein
MEHQAWKTGVFGLSSHSILDEVVHHEFIPQIL